MKQRLLFTCFLFTTALCSQTSFTTKGKYECRWNEASKNYNDCMAFSDSSTFIFDHDNKKIVQSNSKTNSWFIVERKTQERGVYVYFLLNERVEECFIVLDTRRGEIKVSSPSVNDELVSYNIISTNDKSLK